MALDANFDVRRAALFDPSVSIDGIRVSAAPEPLPTRAAVSYPAPNRTVAELSAPAPAGSALVVSENWYPGWSAVVDGRPAAVGRADYAFLGVALPDGAKQVGLSFRDRAYLRGGRLITLAALAATGAAIVIGGLLGRRGRV